MNKVMHKVLVAGLLAGAGLYASAQPAPPPAAGADQHRGPAAGPRGPQGPHDPAKMREMMARHHAQRLAEFKTVLRITPAQEGAWTAFAASMTPQPGMMGMHRSPEERAKMRAELDKLSTPERMEKMRAMRNERHAKMSAEMDKRMAAVKTFYAALSPEQQKVFDIAHKRMAERHMGRGMGHHGGGMMQHG